MPNAISWFEIPTTQLHAAQAFYEAVLQRPMRRETMGPSQGAVFAYSRETGGVGGAIALRRQALPPGMGFFAHIHDLDGSHVGLHAMT